MKIIILVAVLMRFVQMEMIECPLKNNASIQNVVGNNVVSYKWSYRMDMETVVRTRRNESSFNLDSLSEVDLMNVKYLKCSMYSGKRFLVSSIVRLGKKLRENKNVNVNIFSFKVYITNSFCIVLVFFFIFFMVRSLTILYKNKNNL